MWDIIVWLVVGLIAGGLAKVVVKGEEPGGALWSIIIGLLGLHFGGFFGSTFVAFAGAVVLLLIYHAVMKRRGAAPPTG